MNQPTRQVFATLLAPNEALRDRALDSNDDRVDVVIPVFNTNALFEKNLLSIYREIPVNRLIIGDGGCQDDTLDIARKFPRVEIVDQAERRSLGFCLREMIERVETPHVIYLHSDVYLPEGWYDAMRSHAETFDWFECRRVHTYLLAVEDEAQFRNPRPYSGSQMGRSDLLKQAMSVIEDDYLYRNEDLVIKELVERRGGRYGKIGETHHFHQMMNNRGEKEPPTTKISVERSHDLKWIDRTFQMQVRGLIKYTSPIEPALTGGVLGAIRVLAENNLLDRDELMDWTRRTNPAWEPWVERFIRESTGRRAILKREFVVIARALRRLWLGLLRPPSDSRRDPEA